MKRKLRLAFLAVLMIFVLLPGFATAAEVVESGSCGDNATYTLDDNGTLIISGTGSVKEETFMNRKDIVNVVIGEGIAKIEYRAFMDCTSLESLSLPDTLNDIWMYAFRGCGSLDSLKIPGNLKSIGYDAFRDTGIESVYITDMAAWCALDYSNNTLLKGDRMLYLDGEPVIDLVIPDGVEYINYHVFDSYDALKSVTIPSSLKSLGIGAFYHCSNLQSVYISDMAAWCRIDFGDNYYGDLLSDGRKLYLNGELVTDLVIPGDAVTVSRNAFYKYEHLKSVKISEGVTAIEPRAFDNCTALQSVDLPKSLVFIDNTAFWKCSALATIKIPENVRSIGAQAFNSCTALSSISLSDNLIRIGSQAFLNCPALKDVYYGGSKEQFAKMTIGDHNDPLLNANIHYNSGSVSGGGSSSGKSAARYNVNVPGNVSGGAVSVSPTKAAKGDTVIITVAADEDYKLSDLIVSARGEGLALQNLGDGKYSFIMPDDKVDVEALFVRSQDVCFADVAQTDYYFDAVQWAVGKNITQGTTADTFSPDDICTRAQMVTFLWRAAGSPEPKGEFVNFADLADGAYYEKAVCWAVEQGITNGDGNYKFSPDAAVTRSQVVTLLWRAADSPAIAGNTAFSDLQAGAYYSDAVQWAVAKNITKGVAAGTFAPDDKCTRAEIATFMFRNQ